VGPTDHAQENAHKIGGHGSRLLDWKLASLGTAQNLVNIVAGAPEQVQKRTFVERALMSALCQKQT